MSSNEAVRYAIHALANVHTTPGLPERPDWFAQRNCGTTDEMFPDNRTDAARAIARYCNHCPVTTECGDYRKELGEHWGIWGGQLYGMGKAHIDARPLDNKVIDLARRERVRNSDDPAVAVVEGLASFDEPVTGPDLADAINLSRSYVRRRLRLLERQGRAVSRWGRGFDRHGRPYNVRTWRYIPPDDDESAGAAAPTAAPADDPNTQGTFQHQGAES